MQLSIEFLQILTYYTLFCPTRKTSE